MPGTTVSRSMRSSVAVEVPSGKRTDAFHVDQATGAVTLKDKALSEMLKSQIGHAGDAKAIKVGVTVDW